LGVALMESPLSAYGSTPGAGEPGGARTRDPVLKRQAGRVLLCVEKMGYPVHMQ
jgi:hypothetical protein